MLQSFTRTQSLNHVDVTIPHQVARCVLLQRHLLALEYLWPAFAATWHSRFAVYCMQLIVHSCLVLGGMCNPVRASEHLWRYSKSTAHIFQGCGAGKCPLIMATARQNRQCFALWHERATAVRSCMQCIARLEKDSSRSTGSTG